MKRAADPPCPCGSGQTYRACCEPLHSGAVAATAEALMRSRYSAYGLSLHAYLLDTWHSSTRPASLESAADEAAPRWLGLAILDHRCTGENAASVEFIARYRIGGGSAQRLHERSRFVRETNGRWYYLDGEFPRG